MSKLHVRAAGTSARVIVRERARLALGLDLR